MTKPHTNSADHPGPLADVSIVDISSVVASPFAAGLMADVEVDVIKIEIPGSGDPVRALAPHKDWVSLRWKATNRCFCASLGLPPPRSRDLQEADGYGNPFARARKPLQKGSTYA